MSFSDLEKELTIFINKEKYFLFLSKENVLYLINRALDKNISSIDLLIKSFSQAFEMMKKYLFLVYNENLVNIFDYFDYMNEDLKSKKSETNIGFLTDLVIFYTASEKLILSIMFDSNIPDEDDINEIVYTKVLKKV